MLDSDRLVVDETFRNYKDSERQDGVEYHYRMMRQNQTLDYVLRMKEKHSQLGRKEMTIVEAFEALGDFVDASDPDTSLPNVVHMLQTAESIRAAGEPDWLQLTGLIHDLGKLVSLFAEPVPAVRPPNYHHPEGQDGNAGDQWGIVGDTFIVGCRLPSSCVFPQFNELNPDMANPNYNTELGIYEPHCGITNTHCAFGHDEYLYMVLKNHDQCTLPSEALDVIRYHSMYPWHQGGAYRELMDESDEARLAVCQKFQKFDLYTKHGEIPNVDALWPYYQQLIDKYVPGKLKW